jgi:hypothetical protein
MQNTEYLPHDESTQLKRLGFNLPCFFCFDAHATLMRCSVLKENDEEFRGINHNAVYHQGQTYTSQPSYHQAIKWFRDRHGLHAEPIWDNDNGTYWFFSITMVGDVEFDAIDLGRSETYEEAELACVRKLISLIENNTK